MTTKLNILVTNVKMTKKEKEIFSSEGIGLFIEPEPNAKNPTENVTLRVATTVNEMVLSGLKSVTFSLFSTEDSIEELVESFDISNIPYVPYTRVESRAKNLAKWVFIGTSAVLVAWAITQIL